MNSKTKVLSAHSDVGASSMDRWDACAGSVRLIDENRDRLDFGPSPYAAEGTKAHGYGERRLKDGAWPKDFHQESEDLKDAVSVYVAHVEEVWKNIPRNEKSKIFFEHKFHEPNMHKDFRGTADCVIYSAADKHLFVIDYKHGAGVPVEAFQNKQLMYYGIGAMVSIGLKVEKITLTIVQPRVQTKAAVDSWEVDYDDLLAFAGDVIAAIKRTEDKDAPLVTGDHCRWCPAKPLCPQLRREAEVAMKEEFALSELSNLDPETLGHLLSKLEVVEDWVKGVREYAYQRAKVGEVPVGWKLVPKRATRKWADPVAALKKFESAIIGSVMRDLMTEPELKSPAQVEKILGKGQKELVDSLVVAISSGDTLVPDSDKRQEINQQSRIEKMFD